MFTKEQLDTLSPTARELLLAYGKPVVARSESKNASCGLAPGGRGMANLDCLGEGPVERVRVGRQVGYPALAYFSWLDQRLTVEKARRRVEG